MNAMTELRDDASASAMGLDTAKVESIWNSIRDAVAAGETPGGVAVVSRRGSRIRFAYGNARNDSTGTTPVSFDTIYDCASLTKVTVALPLILLLIDLGKLRLDDPVAAFVPEFASQGKQGVTVRHLLTHTSGLAPFYDMHSHGWDKEKIVSYICGSALGFEPGTSVTYSDLGFILLGEIASRTLGMPLDEAANKFVFEPAGMAESAYKPSASLLPRIAPTEFDAPSGACIHGVVHDENARAMGGVSGHAGLFSTADDMIRYAEMWLAEGKSNVSRVLSKAAVQAATKPWTDRAEGGNRGLGWVLKGDKFDASGDYMSSLSYGHTGFTGTSLYVDPSNEIACVLLTNRVHYGRNKSVVNLRAKFHNTVLAAIVD